MCDQYMFLNILMFGKVLYGMPLDKFLQLLFSYWDPFEQKLRLLLKRIDSNCEFVLAKVATTPRGA